VNKNRATIEYKILAQHCNDFASLEGDFAELIATLEQARLCRIEVFVFESGGPCHISHEEIVGSS